METDLRELELANVGQPPVTTSSAQRKNKVLRA